MSLLSLEAALRYLRSGENSAAVDAVHRADICDDDVDTVCNLILEGRPLEAENLIQELREEQKIDPDVELKTDENGQVYGEVEIDEDADRETQRKQKRVGALKMIEAFQDQGVVGGNDDA